MTIPPSDQAVEAFDRIARLLAHAAHDTTSYPGWVVARDAHSNAALAYRLLTDPYWRVLTGTQMFTLHVGRAAVQRFGRQWAASELVLCGNDRTTIADYLPTDSTARVLRIPLTALENWHGPRPLQTRFL